MNERPVDRPVFPGDSAAYNFLHDQEIAPTGLEHSRNSAEKPAGSQGRGTESGTLGGKAGFADAVMAIMRLPLTDAEKGEAVRGLLGNLGCSNSRARSAD
jgi:hypothetical protein